MLGAKKCVSFRSAFLTRKLYPHRISMNVPRRAKECATKIRLYASRLHLYQSDTLIFRENIIRSKAITKWQHFRPNIHSCENLIAFVLVCCKLHMFIFFFFIYDDEKRIQLEYI